MDSKEMKKNRKNLQILEVASTDKENMTQKIAPKKKMNLNYGNRIRLGKKEGKVIEPDNKHVVDIKNNINMIRSNIPLKKKETDVTVCDLISDKPSENYWEKMAESRRIALESALKENVDLNNKLSEMEYENGKLKEMLKEAQTLVEVLTEMLEGGNSDSEAGTTNETKQTESDDEAENESFQSCI